VSSHNNAYLPPGTWFYDPESEVILEVLSSRGMYVAGLYYYTVRVIRGGTWSLDVRQPSISPRRFVDGESQLIREAHLRLYFTRCSHVPIGFCPECEDDDSIFYGEDYICAFCRDRLDDPWPE
jgi:hypothetical protein